MTRISCGFEGQAGESGRDLLERAGPALLVEIGFDAAFNAARPHKPAQKSSEKVRALIDTGAFRSCIDSDLAVRIGLLPTDELEFSGIGGVATMTMYLAQIHVPTLQFTLYGRFAGVMLAAGGQAYDVLLGRDFLRHFHMAYDGPTGAVTLIDHSAPMPIEVWPDE